MATRGRRKAHGGRDRGRCFGNGIGLGLSPRVGILAVLALWVGVVSAEQLRGVSPEKMGVYRDALAKGQFACLDGSGVLDSDAVNDDYCDCKDGSDEPGTSACSNGSFYCRNKMFVAKTISSMFVDDGVCDCCDGSDEKSGICSNTCKLEGAEMTKALQASMQNIKEGLKRKTSMAAKNTISVPLLKPKIAILENKIDATTILLTKLKDKEHERQQLEIEALKLEMEEEKAKSGSDVGDASDDYEPSDEEHDAAEREEEQEDETEEERGRRIAARWTNDPDAAAASEEGWDAEDAEDESYPEEDDSPLDDEEIRELAAMAPMPEDTSTKSKDDVSFEDFKKELGIVSDGDSEGTFLSLISRGFNAVRSVFTKGGGADPATQLLADEIRNQDQALRSMKEELKKWQDMIAFDFGEDNMLLPMYDKCYTAKIRDYKYEICPFKKASQDRVSLGEYTGLSGGDRKQLLFKKGQKCWNGPDRSITVDLQCGPKEEILSVVEPSMCEYLAVLETPLACEQKHLEEVTKEYENLVGLHDEL